jgi:Tfp pilus assembly protein PilF
LAKGIDYLHQAIAVDPSYALAYDGLALYYRVADDWFLSPKDSMPKAKEAAAKALELDDGIAESHTEMGVVHLWYDWDWQATEGEFRRAIELDPSYAAAHHWYGWYLVCTGQTDEGLAKLKGAQELDPLDAEMNVGLGIGLYFARRYGEASEQLRRTIDLEPQFWFAHTYLGHVYEQTGRLPDAIAEFKKAAELEGSIPETRSALAHAYAASGARGEAQKILEKLLTESKLSYIPPYNIAALHAGLGNKDRALAFLEQAYEERSLFMVWLKVDPQFDGLRSDPRFQDLIRHVHLDLVNQ